MLAVSKGKYGVHSSLLAWENPRRESLIRPKKKKKRSITRCKGEKRKYTEQHTICPQVSVITLLCMCFYHTLLGAVAKKKMGTAYL